MKYNINKDDLRWCKADGRKMTYIETLEAMCRVYGPFCGMGHNTAFWARTEKEARTLSESQAKAKVFEIEREAEASVEYERWFQ